MKMKKTTKFMAAVTSAIISISMSNVIINAENAAHVSRLHSSVVSETLTVNDLMGTKYYEKVLNWFCEKGISREEQENLLNDSEFIKDAMRDSYWTKESNSQVLALNSLSFPIAGYGDGTYFSNNRSACTHHALGTCSYNGSCGCRSYKSSIQCAGFAKLVYWAKKGVDYTGDDYRAGLSSANWSEAKLKKYFYTDGEITVGSYIRLVCKSGLPHSFIVTSISSTGIGIYDCNFYNNNCEIDLRTQTWSQLKNDYSEITAAYIY